MNQHLEYKKGVTKGCLLEDRGAHLPLTQGPKTTPLRLLAGADSLGGAFGVVVGTF